MTFGQAFNIECLNTFFLVFVVLAFTQRPQIPKMAYGGAIGFMLGMLICGTGKLTGCAANPFRALGPNLINGDFYELLVYLTAPFVGSLFAGIVFYFIIDKDHSTAGKAEAELRAKDIEGEFENLEN